MKAYLEYAKNGFMDNSAHRMHVFLGAIVNVIYIVILFFLWKSIYSGKEVINGMTFNQTMIYITFATALFGLFQTYVENYISCRVIFGSIIVDFVKPIDFQSQVLFRSLGTMVFNLFVITIPVIILSVFVFHLKYFVGINLIFFAIALIFAVLLINILDFTVGLVSFYTESIWGITVIKEVLVATMAGVYVPLEFYPEKVRVVLDVLPFKAIYHTPLTLLVDTSISSANMLYMLTQQFIWLLILFILSRILFKRAFKSVISNGG